MPVVFPQPSEGQPYLHHVLVDVLGVPVDQVDLLGVQVLDDDPLLQLAVLLCHGCGAVPVPGWAARGASGPACSSCPVPLALLQAKINVLAPEAALNCPLKGLSWGQPLCCHLRGMACVWVAAGLWAGVGVQPPSPAVPWDFSPSVGETVPKLGQKASKAWKK